MKNTKLTPESIGHHVIANLHGISNPSYFDDIEVIKDIVYKIAGKAGMTIVGEAHKKFEPQGFTSCFILSESHFTLHFWPEHAYMSVDIYTCGSEGDPSLAMKLLIEELKPNMKESSIEKKDRSIYIKEVALR